MTPSRRLYAFSLIELLVVIGLIAILGTLLLMGINHLIINSKRQQTRQTFQNLQAMYSEWDAVNHRHLPSYLDPLPAGMVGGVVVTPLMVTVPAPQNVTLAGNPTPSATVETADDTTQFNRYGQAVWETRDVMQLLTSIPGNATALGKMSASASMTFPAILDGNNVATIPNPYYATIDSPWNTNHTYVPAVAASKISGTSQIYSFAEISTTNAFGGTTLQLFRCIQVNPAPSFAPPDTRYWIPVGSAVPSAANGGILVSSEATVPVPLDAWGNPIIFVPGGELGSAAALSSGATGYPLPGSGAIATSPGASGRSITVTSPDGRPFWASAGPDGDFSLGDDNLYSFER